jgi:transforming growth factor-beta-induced protein
MKRHLNRVIALSFFLALTITGLAMAADNRMSGNSSKNLVERLEKMGGFSILLTALDTAGLKETVATGGPFTLFAPTDEAFGALLAQLDVTAPELLENPELANILLYHVASGRVRAGELIRSSTQPTLSDEKSVLVVREESRVFVNRAMVTRANVSAGNGIIHVIDTVLLPPAELTIINSMLDVLRLDGRFSVLLAALEATGLDDVVATGGPFTLFAPTDEAFTVLLSQLGISADQLLQSPDLSDILLYHVLGESKRANQLVKARQSATVQGDDVKVRLRSMGVFINESRVINSNVNTPNGVIHAIDGVLLP